MYSELFGLDVTSASDEQVSSCVTLVHMYCTPWLSKFTSNMCAVNKYVGHKIVYHG